VGLREKDLEAPAFFSCFCADSFRSGEVSFVAFRRPHPQD
jgi:hypothetical protein